MAIAYAKMGSNVRLLEKNERILGGHDPEIVRVVELQMKKKGIEIFTQASAEKFENKKLYFTQQKEKRWLETEKLLVAVGVQPNTQTLRLENTQAKKDAHGFIIVNKKMQTTDPKIFAIGDTVGGKLLAHKAYQEGKVAAEVIAGYNSVFDNKTIPSVIFSDPEIAETGLTEKEARKTGYEVTIGKFPFSASGRSLTKNAPQGLTKIIAEKKTGAILGAQIVGNGASDLIGEMVLAIEMGATTEDLAFIIHPHPTLPETIGEAAAAILGKAIHLYTPKK
jgi:dihydrolipoamide dehydrogenase